MLVRIKWVIELSMPRKDIYTNQERTRILAFLSLKKLLSPFMLDMNNHTSKIEEVLISVPIGVQPNLV